jgi:hypothetical protein
MAQVRVWNDNTHPYTETFREQRIHIKPKSYVLMEEGEAHDFKCSFAPAKLDADGRPVAEGYKMIRIERHTEDAPEPVAAKTALLCQACRYEGENEADLNEHIKATHAAQIVRDEQAEAELAKRPKKRSKAG